MSSTHTEDASCIKCFAGKNTTYYHTKQYDVSPALRNRFVDGTQRNKDLFSGRYCSKGRRTYSIRTNMRLKTDRYWPGECLPAFDGADHSA